MDWWFTQNKNTTYEAFALSAVHYYYTVTEKKVNTQNLKNLKIFGFLEKIGSK